MDLSTVAHYGKVGVHGRPSNAFSAASALPFAKSTCLLAHWLPMISGLARGQGASRSASQPVQRTFLLATRTVPHTHQSHEPKSP
eukprot:2947569-Prymnesium_polylepis.1